MGNLKKVLFRLDNTDYGFFDNTEEERRKIELLQKEQKGLFHQWGTELIETESGSILPRTVGIVEDVAGKVHKVDPELIKFI